MRICIQFDETKPHWAIQRGYDKVASQLGMRDIKLTGDFDTKLAYLYGTVDDYDAFAESLKGTVLEEGSLYQVSTF